MDSYHPAPIPGSSHTAYIELTPTVGRLLLVGDNGSAREPAAPQLRDLNVRYPTASPSGEAVAVSVAFDLLVLEPFHDPPTVHRLTDGDSHDTEPTWAPDERAIAFTRLTPPDPHTGSHSSDIFMIDLTSGDVTQLTASGNAASPRWSPSGEWIAWDDQTTVGLVASTGVASSQNGDGGLGSAWSPDGTSLVYGRGDSLIVWDVPTGGESPVAEGLPGEVHSPDWDESGDRIAFLVGRTGAGSAAYELDRPSGTVRKVSAAVSRDAVYTRA